MFELGIEMGGLEKKIYDHWQAKIEDGQDYAEAWLRESLPHGAIAEIARYRGMGDYSIVSKITFSDEFISEFIDPRQVKNILRLYVTWEKVISDYVLEGKKTKALRFFIEKGLLKAEVVKGKAQIINAKELNWYSPKDLVGLALIRKVMDKKNIISGKKEFITEISSDSQDINKDGVINEQDGLVRDFTTYHDEVFQKTHLSKYEFRDVLRELGGEHIPIPRLYMAAQTTREGLHQAILEAADEGWLMFETIPYSESIPKEVMSLTIPTDDDSYVFYISFVPDTLREQPKNPL